MIALRSSGFRRADGRAGHRRRLAEDGDHDQFAEMEFKGDNVRDGPTRTRRIVPIQRG